MIQRRILIWAKAIGKFWNSRKLYFKNKNNDSILEWHKFKRYSHYTYYPHNLKYTTQNCLVGHTSKGVGKIMTENVCYISFLLFFWRSNIFHYWSCIQSHDTRNIFRKTMSFLIDLYQETCEFSFWENYKSVKQLY